MSHIAVERNRRRQMNEYLKVLRSLTPSFYIKRGDQASIIGGVIEFIKELEQVLEALEWKKRRKSLSPSYSPRTACSKNFEVDHHHSPPLKEAEAGGASCNSEVADVEVKISGPNVILRVITHKIPGQVSNIITILETLSFQVLHLNISSMQDTVLYHFVLKIGLECQLSLEELAMGVQQSFCSDADLALN